MLRNFLQRVDRVKQYIKDSLKQKNIFQFNNRRTYSNDQIVKAIRFALASNATDYKNFVEVEYHLSAIISYMESGQKIQAVEQLLILEQQVFWSTPKHVLYMFNKYLQRVMPTNITYYHFIREKEFYTQYIAIKYILVVGLSQEQHIFHKMKTTQRLNIFHLLLEWLLTLVYYRCSAIYIKSNCVNPLIYQAHLLLSILFGQNGDTILLNLTAPEVNDVANKMLYIQGFMLSMAIPTKNYLWIEVIINTLRKLLTSASQQRIIMYLPSYLYAKIIGYVKTPYTTQIIYRLLIFFLNQNKIPKEGHESAQIIQIEEFNRSNLITQCWSILSLLAEEYQLDKTVSKQLILATIQNLENKSINRAFVLRIAHTQHLDLQDEKISQYIKKRKQPYVVSSQVIQPSILAKNYHCAMQHEYYLKIISQASKNQWQKIDQAKLWQSTTQYNKFEIASMDDYLMYLRSSEKAA